MANSSSLQTTPAAATGNLTIGSYYPIDFENCWPGGSEYLAGQTSAGITSLGY